MAAPALVAWPQPVNGAVDRGSSDAEEFGEFGLGIWAEVVQFKQMFGLVGLSFGCLPRSRPLAFATFIPSRVRSRTRSASTSATIANTLNNSRPTVSVGSWIEPPRLSLTLRLVSSSKMSRASGSDRASRSSLVTTNVSPARPAASANRSLARSRLVPVRP